MGTAIDKFIIEMAEKLIGALESKEKEIGKYDDKERSYLYTAKATLKVKFINRYKKIFKV